MNSPSAGRPPASKRLLNWGFFVFIMLLPPIFALLTSLGGMQAATEVFTLLGSPLAGLVCGIQLGQHVANPTLGRAMATLFFVGGMTILIFFLCFAGCGIGGYNLVVR